jgi:hypothetical protein
VESARDTLAKHEPEQLETLLSRVGQKKARYAELMAEADDVRRSAFKDVELAKWYRDQASDPSTQAFGAQPAPDGNAEPPKQFTLDQAENRIKRAWHGPQARPVALDPNSPGGA